MVKQGAQQEHGGGGEARMMGPHWVAVQRGAICDMHAGGGCSSQIVTSTLSDRTDGALWEFSYQHLCLILCVPAMFCPALLGVLDVQQTPALASVEMMQCVAQGIPVSGGRGAATATMLPVLPRFLPCVAPSSCSVSC